MNDEKLWLWRFDTNALTKYLEAKGFQRTHRIIGEFSEFQRRFSGFTRKLLLQFNNICYGIKFIPHPAITNLLIFEKTGEILGYFFFISMFRLFINRGDNGEK
jgi:hypothetical protein